MVHFFLETAFPLCALHQCFDSQVDGNNRQLEELQDDNAYKRPHELRLWGGSQAEGFCMEKNWGHGVADRDVMRLYGGELGVKLAGTKDHALLVYRPEDCPAAYCKLEVRSREKLLEYLERGAYKSQVKPSNCIVTGEDRRHWLHVKNLVGMLHGDNVVGPAGQSSDGLMDMVSTLVFSDPHPDIESFYHRCQGKKWPSSDVLDTLRKLRMLLVPVGHKLSPPAESDLQTRTSWSPHELHICRSLPSWTKQGYVAFKYTFKNALRQKEGDTAEIEGRSKISSYHLKTTLLYTMEKNPPNKVGQPFKLFLKLLHTLQSFLKRTKLPHFFLPECNLLETVSKSTQQAALDTVCAILDDPLGAILRSPIDPEELYGDVKVNDLLKLTKLNPPKLRSLVRRLDEHRASRYKALVKKDEKNKVSDRPNLIRLADLLEHKLN